MRQKLLEIAENAGIDGPELERIRTKLGLDPQGVGSAGTSLLKRLIAFEYAQSV